MNVTENGSGSWQPDPFHRYAHRWWDGVKWTDNVDDGSGIVLADPLGTQSVQADNDLNFQAPPTAQVHSSPMVLQPGTQSAQPQSIPSATQPGLAYPMQQSYGQQTPNFNMPGGGAWAAPQQIVVSNASKSPGLAVSALVLGVGAFFFSLIPLFGFVSIPFAIVGLALGIAGIVRANKGFEGRGLSIAGVVGSIAALVVSLVYIFALGSAVNDSVGRVNSINSDTPNGICDPSRALQDPDC